MNDEDNIQFQAGGREGGSDTPSADANPEPARVNDGSEPDITSQSERVFDITPDLNISPVKDDSENVPPVARASISRPVKPPINRLEDLQVPPVQKAASQTSLNQTPIQQSSPAFSPTPPIAQMPVNEMPQKPPPLPSSIRPAIPEMVQPTDNRAPVSPPLNSPLSAPARNQQAAPMRPIQQPIYKQPPPFQSPVKTQPEIDPRTMPAPTSSSIPLRDVSVPIDKARNIPANPPTKTIFFNQSAAPGLEKKQTLQARVSSMTESSKQPAQNPNIASNPNVKPIRTYEGDVAEVLSHTRTSTASIAIAESQKAEVERQEPESPPAAFKEPSHAGRKILIAVICLILIGGGAFGAYYFYSMSPLAPVTPVAQQPLTVPDLVPTDSRVTIPIDNLNALTIQSRIQAEVSKPQPPDSIEEIILSKTTNGVTNRVTGPDIVRIMDVSAPDMLTRSLAPAWMLGVYADASGAKSIFVVFTNNFFQNAFAGMLSWESVMPDDIKQYLYATPPQGVANAPATAPTTVQASNPTGTTTPSTQPSVTPYTTVRGQFYDRIIQNKDVREFRTGDGRIVFLYSFIDNTKLVVTGNEQTLAEIVKRLDKQAFVR